MRSLNVRLKRRGSAENGSVVCALRGLIRPSVYCLRCRCREPWEEETGAASPSIRRLGYIFVNTSSLGTVGQMVPAAAGSALPYRNLGGYTRFIDQDGYPCQQPPWGELSAVNANTGEIVWRKPLGSYDELEAQGLKNTGASNIGGSIVTAGGLVFIAATTDSKFRAFDSRTGKELWVTKLDASGTTVPMTYLGRDGKQYVVVAAGGTNRFQDDCQTADKNSDALIAFAISDQHEAGSSSRPDSSPALALGSTNSAAPCAPASSTVTMADLPDWARKSNRRLRSVPNATGPITFRPFA